MKNKITPNVLAALCNGLIIGKQHADEPIENILFDSRRLNTISSTAFFALSTNKNDGNNYINFLYNKGIRIFVTSKEPIATYQDATFLVVENVLDCLQTLAKEHRRNFTDLNCVAITGSNGKTIVKDWIVKLIDRDKKVCSNAKSFNSQIGVPISVYGLKQGDEIGVFEAGISSVGEMQRLKEIIQPTTGVFTNIGDAHQVNFSSLEEKIDEKLKLFSSCSTIIFHDDNPLLTNKITTFATNRSIDLICFGNNFYSNSTKVKQYYDTQDLLSRLSLPFTDKAGIENSLMAYVTCLTLGIDKRHLQQRIRFLEQLESRFEVKSGINNSLIVNDSYSCDLKSLEIALDYLNLQNKSHKTVILSDLQQSNADKDELYKEINTLLLNKGIKNLIAIGSDFYNNRHHITIENTKFYLSVDDFILNLKRKDFNSHAILIKGATSMHFENISNLLSNKVHQSVWEVNLSALEDNVRYFRSHIKPPAMVMAMVKANAYGCGSYQVAYALEKNNLADYFAVAFADEGVELKRQGIQKPIIVMTPEPDSTNLIKAYNLEPVVHSFKVLDRFLYDDINIHIKLDTGMHRLGFEAKDINTLVSTLKSHPNVHIKSIFSHLYGADDPSLDAYTYEQINLYEQMSDFIVNSFDYKIIRHICNSAATIRFPQAHYDMVRLGIGMYGIGANAVEQQKLRFVHRLRTTITQIREIKQGEDVSYSRRFVSSKPMKIGVIPIGYADGLNRHLGNENFEVYVNGKYCKILGNICMDMCMIDLTNVNATEGDTAIIFGIENPVFKMSQALNTIPYEIYTSISPRIPRVYYHE